MIDAARTLSEPELIKLSRKYLHYTREQLLQEVATLTSQQHEMREALKSAHLLFSRYIERYERRENPVLSYDDVKMVEFTIRAALNTVRG